ncbi:MAG: ATPase, T2SS/T4P/T4SS family, partial [Herbaspirillum sp.]
MEREQATRFMHDLLRLMTSKNGSDLFITAGFPPAFKIDGKIAPVSNQALTPNHTVELTRAIMNDRQAGDFEATKECNFAINPTGLGRFRVSAFIQQGHAGMVLRTITTKIPKFEDLGLPDTLREVAMTKRGLVIMVGATGSGKSTTLAAMVGYRNENSYGHIITIEDPIEYVHPHGNCIVTQREIGVDTEDWGTALRNSLR